MRDFEFKTKDEAEQFLSDRFQIKDSAVIANFTDETEIISERKPPVGLAPPVLRKRFVIKNDDLQFFDTIWSAVQSSVSAGFFLSVFGPVANVTVTSSIVGVAIAIFKLGRNAYNKRIQIEDRCFKVLATIHNNELTFDELLCDLERQYPTWTDEELKTTLDFLGKIPSFDGTSKQLVIQTSEGKWRTSGL